MPASGLADLHLHTGYSDGWPSPAQVVAHVTRETDLAVIAVTDHDTIEGALRAADHSARTGGVPVIVGEEVSSSQGHILGLFLERRVRPGMSAAATVDEIHRQGGLAVAAHPFWRTRQMAERFGGPVHGIGWLAADLDFDAVEVENSAPLLGLANVLARRLADSVGWPCLGGSDAHILDAIGKSATVFHGRTPRALRTAIETGAVSPVSSRYAVSALLRYVAWGFVHERMAN